MKLLFKKIVFTNYKTFYGHQEINFYIPSEVREEKQKNIILLGGLNGSGKTTILKAILYVLFGKRGISEQEYIRLFSNVINNTFFDEGGRDCSVILTLESDQKEEWQLRVKWTFDNHKRLISENREISVRKPGQRHSQTAWVENIEAFNRIIDKIIPYHAAPFFIFDGEEIKEIILRQNSSEMKDAIHKISGMESYEQLLDDLHQLKDSLEQKLAKMSNKNKLTQLNEQLKELKKEIDDLETKCKTSKNEIQQLEEEIEKIKDLRNHKIIVNSKSREVLVKKQSTLTAELKHTKKELDNFFIQNIIHLILVDEISNLKMRLKLENETRQKKLLFEASLTPYRNFISKLLSEPITPPLSEEQLEQIKKIGEEIWVKENNLIKAKDSEIDEIHDISPNDLNYLLNIKVPGKEKIVQLINKIDKLQLDLQQIEQEIRNAPESVDIHEENTKIDSLTKKLGEKEILHKATLRKLNRLKEQHSTLLNQITRYSDQDEDSEQIIKQLDYLNRVIITTEEYVKKVTILKAEFISEEFSNMLNLLFRKQDEFGKIEFDIKTYTIKLYNDRGQEISIQDRSAGEMQMISSAFIWALTKASDLALPMVIDTPLGRLDSFHRNHLIEHYYTKLSDQVIILSTDTEISQEYIDFMKKHSYRQYMLDYDQEKKYTIIRDGYFNFVRV